MDSYSKNGIQKDDSDADGLCISIVKLICIHIDPFFVLSKKGVRVENDEKTRGLGL